MQNMTATRADIWTWRDPSWSSTNVTGFDVEALDGGIGHVDEHTYEAGRDYIVVDTGPWIFGKKAMLPANTIDRVDEPGRKVYIDRTREQIQDAPEFDPSTHTTESFRSSLGGYYGQGGLGWREPRSF